MPVAAGGSHRAMAEVDQRLKGWIIASEELDICTRADGSGWLLGSGSFGSFGEGHGDEGQWQADPGGGRRVLVSECRVDNLKYLQKLFRHQGLCCLGRLDKYSIRGHEMKAHRHSHWREVPVDTQPYHTCGGATANRTALHEACLTGQDGALEPLHAQESAEPQLQSINGGCLTVQQGSGFLLSAHHQERRDHVVGGPQDGDDEGGLEGGAGGQVHQGGRSRRSREFFRRFEKVLS